MGASHVVIALASRVVHPGRDPGLGDRLILLSRSSSHADRTHDLVVLSERDASGEDHDASVVRGVNAEERVPRLRAPSGQDVTGMALM